MFKKRSTDPELMDDLDFKDDVLFQTLRELDIINSYLGGNTVTLDALQKVYKDGNLGTFKKDVKIGDLGCGSGDSLIKISEWADKNSLSVQLTGYDANPGIVEYAKQHTSAYKSVNFEALNVLSSAFKAKEFDVIVCTLFLHHFDDNTLSDFLNQLKGQTSTAIIINDIHRHWFAYYSIGWLTGLLSKSYMVKYDSKLSVLRAFTRAELERIIKRAGFTKYSITWKWAFRFQVILWP